MLSIAIGICVKKVGIDLVRLIESCPTGLSIIIASGTDETLNDTSLPSGNKYIYISIPDAIYGYDLVRNRKRVFDEFLKTDSNLLFFLDDDEFFPSSVSEFDNFYSSIATVGMLSHQNIFLDSVHHFCGKNYHARLLKKGSFPLEGKIIESVKDGYEKYYLRTNIPHDFCRRGFEDFFLRASRWAKESAYNCKLNTDRTMNLRISWFRQKLGILSPFARFFYHYVIMKGFAKGISGYYISMNYAVGEYFRSAYLFEITQSAKHRKES